MSLRDEIICTSFPLFCQGTADLGTSALSLLVSWLLSCGSEHTEAAKIILQTLSVRFGQCPLRKLDYLEVDPFAFISNRNCQFSFEKSKSKPGLPGSRSGSPLYV